MGALGSYAHLFKGQADLAAYVLALVEWSDVHISRVVVGDVGAVSVVVGLEEIELELGFEVKGVSLAAGVLYGVFQQSACI